MTPRCCVVGEALIDSVTDASGQTADHVGGSPLNVACGLARLSHAVDLATTVGRDPRGEEIASYVAAAGATLTANSITEDPTSVAYATLDASGAASYRFDLHWNLPQVMLSSDTTHLHTGSIGALLAPGAAAVRDAVETMAREGTVSYDPNVRPSIMGPAAGYLAQVEQLIASANYVKASDEDLAVLYPGLAVTDVMTHWCELGASLVVITLGPDGVQVRTAADPQVQALPSGARGVVDTVGAGDSFMAGTISGLLDAGLLGGSTGGKRLAAAGIDEVMPAVARGLQCAAITVEHAGAYGPTRAELPSDT